MLIIMFQVKSLKKANKLIEKKPDSLNAKEHCQSFIRKKNAKSLKQSETTTCQPKTFENPNFT